MSLCKIILFWSRRAYYTQNNYLIGILKKIWSNKIKVIIAKTILPIKTAGRKSGAWTIERNKVTEAVLWKNSK